LPRLNDSELAQAFVDRLHWLADHHVRFSDALRSDMELCAILQEFRRRTFAHDAARSRYRERHLRAAV